MSVQAMTWAFDQDLPQGPKLVLLALANRADRETGRCFPGMELIAKESATTTRSVVRHIEALVRNGYVLREKSRDDAGRQRNNTYFLRLDRDAAKWGDWHWHNPHGHDFEAEEPEDAGDFSAHRSDTVSPGQEAGRVTPCHPENDPSRVTPVSPGPSDIGVTQQPSDSNRSFPTERHQPASPPSGFSKKAQEAEIEAGRIEQAAAKAHARVFVLRGSRAWDAWNAWRARQSPPLAELPHTWATIDGKSRPGWYMPSLFPPPAGERPSGLMRPEDQDFMDKGGMR